MSREVAIAGGGLAGAATAIWLAMAGRSAIVFEREPTPHDKVCGEFLSGAAVAELTTLGVSMMDLRATTIERVRLVSGSIEAVATLPFPALGLSRRQLDERLLQLATSQGVEVRRGVTIKSLEADGAGVKLTGDKASLTATAAILATGKHELRGRRRAGATRLLGLKLHLRLEETQNHALDRHVELALFPGGYAGLQLVEDRIANLCLVVSRQWFAQFGRDWRRLVAAVPHLARRLDGASALHGQPLAIAGMPYGYLCESTDTSSVYHVGDQAAVIPSFTGDGMAMALQSARKAAEAIAAGRSAADFHRELGCKFRGPVRVASFVATAGAQPWQQAALVRVCRFAPGLMTMVAARTRTAISAAGSSRDEFYGGPGEGRPSPRIS